MLPAEDRGIHALDVRHARDVRAAHRRRERRHELRRQRLHDRGFRFARVEQLLLLLRLVGAHLTARIEEYVFRHLLTSHPDSTSGPAIPARRLYDERLARVLDIALLVLVVVVMREGGLGVGS